MAEVQVGTTDALFDVQSLGDGDEVYPFAQVGGTDALVDLQSVSDGSVIIQGIGEDALIVLKQGSIDIPDFPHAGTGMSCCCIHDGHLYVAINWNTSYAEQVNVGNIYKIDIFHPDKGWEYVTQNHWQYSPNSDDTLYNCQFAVDPIAKRFYTLSPTFRNASSVYYWNGGTAYYDIVTGQWEDAAIANMEANSSYSSKYEGNYVLDDYICYHPDKCVSGSYSLAGLRLFPKNALTARIQSAAPKYAHSRPIMFTYANKLYFACGYIGAYHATNRLTFDYVSWPYLNATSVTQFITRYDPVTNSWEDDPIPRPPAWGYGTGSACVAGNKVYLICGTTNLNHYYNMEEGGNWIACEPAPANEEGAVIHYEPVTNMLWYISGRNGVYRMQLREDQTPAGGWRRATYGQVGVVSVSVADVPISFETETKDLFAVDPTVDVPFGFTSFSEYVPLHWDIFLPPQYFDLKSYGEGEIGSIQVDSVDTSFEITSFTKQDVDDSPTMEIIFDFSEGLGTYTDITSLKSSMNVSFFVGNSVAELVHESQGSSHASVIVESKASATVSTISTSTPADAILITSTANGFASSGGQAASEILFDLAFGFGTVTVSGSNPSIAVPPPTIDAWAVNGASGGHAGFINYKFTSIFKLGDTYFGTNENGLYRLEGDLDNEEDIESYVATAITDFGEPKLKAIGDVFTHMRCDGDAQIRVVTDEQRDRAGYAIRSDGREGIHRRRQKTHKGITGTNWQFEIKNIQSSRLEVAEIETRPVKLKRTS